MIIPLKNAERFISKLKGNIFIYPTDTIYGIGCDAENKTLVEKIREIKERDSKPFSVIAPSFEWILKNCNTTEEEIEKYLPGAYTLILKKKNQEFLKWVSNTEFIGVRIPNHPFTKLLQKTGKPIITTSVNLAGMKPANKIEEISERIFEKVGFIIDAGELSGKASTIVKDGKLIER